MKGRLLAATLTALLLLGAESEPSFECTPGLAAVGETITCTGGPFDPGAEAVVTTNVDGAETRRSTFDVDETGQVVRSYVAGSSDTGSTFTLTIVTMAGGEPVTLQAQYRIEGIRPEETSSPPHDGPAPTTSPAVEPVNADQGSGWSEDPLGIMVVAAVAAVGLLVVAAVVAESRRKRKIRW